MEQPLRILILEDVADDAALMQRALQAGGLAFISRRAETREEFLAALDEMQPDAILADYRLPQFDGREALRLARERAPHVPVLIVSGTLHDESAVSLLREGAYDYVLKDRLSRLGAAVRSAIEAARNHAARREAEQRYRMLFNQAHDGIALVDRETGCIVEANPEFERQSGRPAPELAALPVWQICVPQCVEAARAGVDAAAGADGAIWEIDLLRPDGSQVPVEMRARLIQVAQRACLLVSSHDIRARRDAERVLRSQLDELQRFQRVTVDRELRMEELEAELRRLRAGAGQLANLSA